MKILNTFAVLASLLTASVTMAQPASTLTFDLAADKAAPTKSGAVVSFSVDSSYHKFDGTTDSVFVLTPTVTVKDLFVKDLTVGVAMPTYDQSDLAVGGFDVFANYPVWDGRALGGNAAVSLGGGALIPAFDTAFSPDNVVPHVDAGLTIDWGKFSLTENVSFDYIYDGVAFNPILGGTVEDSVFTSETGLAWKACDWFTIGADLDAQFAFDSDSTNVLAGPSFTLTPSSYFNANFGVGLPVYQDVGDSYSETDWVAHGGFSFSF